MDKFIKNEKIDKRLIVCIISLVLVVLKMYFLNNVFLILAVFIMSIAIIIDSKENKPLYLFFMLPLIYVMKFSNDQISLYNVLCIAYFLSMLYVYIIKKEEFQSSTIILLALLMLLVIVNYFISDKVNLFSSVGWILNLIIFCFVMKEINSVDTYKKYASYFAISISIVGICGIVFMNYTNIGIYLNEMRRTNTVIANKTLVYRYSGFDLDPNYFSLQATIALCSILVLNKLINKHNYFLLAVLLIVGLTTISKMYIITLAFICIYYIICNIKNVKKLFTNKKIIIIGIIGVVLVGILSKYIIPVFGSRFNNITSINDLTTGREKIWITYGEYILNNPKVLLIGNGLGVGYINGQASHCTYLLIIYRLGILGTSIFVLFLYSLIGKNKIKIFSNYSIPLIALMIMNFVLDIFDFDSFSYLLVLILGVYKLDKKSSEVIDENK